jgi:hypothetical protein
MRRAKWALGLSVMAMSAMTAGAFARPGGGQFVGPLQETAINQGIPIGQVSPTESVLYSNVPQGAETVFTSGSSPRTGGADEAVFDGPGANLTSMQIGYSSAPPGQPRSTCASAFMMTSTWSPPAARSS